MNKQTIFIDKISPFAQADMKKTGILASLTIAQAILESGWGGSELAIKANNIFGIKGDYNGDSYLGPTKEFVNGKWIEIMAEFRKYPSWLEGLNDHSDKFLTMDIYKNLRGETDYKQACINVQADGYATAPNYSESLIRIIEQYKLYEFDGGNNMKKTIICIDAGHCDKFAGACNGDQMEHKDTLKLALIVEKHLKSWGHTVCMTRNDGGYLDAKNKDTDLYARPEYANKMKADYFLSIHRNSLKGSNATGNEIWVHSKANTYTTAIARAILNEVNAVSPIANRGVKFGYVSDPTNNFAVNRISNMASALLELGFVSNAKDNDIFNANVDEYGLSIATGICKGLGIKYEVSPPTPPPEPVVPPVPPTEPVNEVKYLRVGGFDSNNMEKGESLKAFLDSMKIYSEWE